MVLKLARHVRFSPPSSRQVSSTSRRDFLKWLAMGAMAPVATTACSGQPLLRDLRFTNFAAARQEVQALATVTKLQQVTPWSLAKTLIHCAQSIEYILSGFPQVYSPVYHNTLGKAERNLFQWQGYMRHNLTDPIPGAAPIADDTPLPEAVVRISYAMEHFRLHPGPFMPHFAYGKINKTEHEILQAMHIANHLSAYA